MIWHEEKGPEKFIQSLEISDNDDDFNHYDIILVIRVTLIVGLPPRLTSF